MRFLPLLSFLASIIAFKLPAQDAMQKWTLKIDSLKKQLQTEFTDTTRVNLFNSLSVSYSSKGNQDSAVYFADQAISLSKKANYSKGHAKALFNIALVHKTKGDYDSAIEFSNRALELYQTSDNKKGIGSCLAEIGTILRIQGNYNKALDYHLKGLSVREELGDKLGIAASLNAIASVYTNRGEFEKALQVNLKSIKLSEEAGEKKDVASTYNNIGNLYLKLNNYSKALHYFTTALNLNEKSGNLKWKAVNLNNIALIYIDKKDFDKALEFYQQSLSIKEKLGEKNGIANTLMNIGIAHGNKGNQAKAIEYCNKALKIREEIGDKPGQASSLQSLGAIYLEKGDTKKSIEVLNQGVMLSKEIGARNVLQICYYNLSATYEKINDLKNSLKYYKLSSIEKDSLLNVQTAESMTKMSAQFDSEKKDNEIKLLNKDKEKQEAIVAEERKNTNILIFSITGGLIFVLVFFIFVYRSYRQKKKDNFEIMLQKEIIQEKNNEVKASISYAKRIQTAIMPSDKLMREIMPNSFVFFKPKDIVSGDFYWLQKTEEKTLFAVVDCTGHGVPGALVSVVGYNALNRTVNEFGLRDPAAILDKLNSLVEETFRSAENELKDGMDISLCSLDPVNNTLEWAGANNPLWIISNGILKEIKGDKQPIGKFVSRKPFTTHTIQLNKNDLIYIFSDGLADQFGGLHGKKFKYKQIKDLLLQSCNKQLKEQEEELSKAFIKWKGELEQVDDICLMGVKI